MALALDIVFVTLAVLLLSVTVRALQGLRRLRDLPPSAMPRIRTRVSVVVPARNEAERIEGTVSKLLAQVGVDLELIVVDDRSDDGTDRRLATLAAAHPELTVLRVGSLPTGWLGKCHALHLGAARATGDWLLFADADAWIGPDVLARAIAAAGAHGLQHVTLMPQLAGTSTLGRTAVLTLCLGLLRHAAALLRARPRTYLGFGAFNLVQRPAYQACGGHERLRLEVIDDMRLARELARSGARSGVWFCRDLEVRWITTLRQFFRLVEKNMCALVGFSPSRALLGATVATAFWVTAVAGAFVGSAAGWLATLALLSTILPAAGMARRYGWSTLAAWLVPILAWLPIAALARSMALAWARGGIRWRDTTYPLAELRAAATALARGREG